MKTIATLSCLALVVSLHAQTSFTISGMVTDSSGAPLQGATVVLMTRADSVLTAFGITESNGAFSLPKTKKGAYLLQITYIGYHTHQQAIELSADLDLGDILLAPQSTVLKEVVVQGEHIPIAIRNDTIEYNAAAFQVEPNAPVEELLKKLPGVEVDRQGNIRAQGEQVEKVLVDGKEFFGNDPKIATKNLPADAVDKVQVFDKKSDMAEFSGIDDGQEQRTINLALKEDKKQGYFGNASAGYGTDNRYQGKANINRFSKKLQLSGLGMANNINEAGFSIQDYLNFMGGLQNMAAGGGTFRIALGDNDAGMPLNLGQNNGIASTLAGGLNMNLNLGSRTEWHASYFYNHLQNDLERNTRRQNLLQGDTFSTEEETLQDSRNANHRFNTTLKHEIDSLQQFRLRGALGFSDAFLDSYRYSQTLGANSSQGLYQSHAANINAELAANYMRRFRKPGRVLAANLDFKTGSNESDGTVYSEITFQSEAADTVRQRQEGRAGQLGYGARLSYTEPVGRGKYLEVNYARQNYRDETKKDFFDVLPPSERLNPGLSAHYLRDYLYDRGGLSFRYNRKKISLLMMAALQQSRLNGELADENLLIEKTFTNFLPGFRGSLEFTSSRRLELEYDTYVQEPSLEQLQPIVDNSDPLQVYAGNPDLRAAFSHSLETRFMSFDQFSGTNFFANLRGRFTKDRIANSQTVDSLFRQFIMPVNVPWDWEGNGYFSFGAPLRFIKTRVNFNANARYNRQLVFVNNLASASSRWSGALGLSLENVKKKWLDAVIGAEWSFNATRFDEAGALNQDFFRQNFYADLAVKPTKKWSVSQSIELTVFSGNPFPDVVLGPVWEASVSRLFLQNRLQIKASVFDILNRNTGISRSSQFNYLQEERVNALGRYLMLSATWSLSGFGSERSGIQITTNRR